MIHLGLSGQQGELHQHHDLVHPLAAIGPEVALKTLDRAEGFGWRIN
jgi:hypothetical protein